MLPIEILEALPQHRTEKISHEIVVGNVDLDNPEDTKQLKIYSDNVLQKILRELPTVKEGDRHHAIVNAVTRLVGMEISGYPLNGWGSKFKQLASSILPEKRKHEVDQILEWAYDNLEPVPLYLPTKEYGLFVDDKSKETAQLISTENNSLPKIFLDKEAVSLAEKLATKIKSTTESITKTVLNSFENYEDRRERLWGYEPKWLIDDWVFDEAVTLIAAPPQRFKTWLCADMAWSVVTGNDFLGQYPVNRSGNVLIVQQEDAENKLQDRYDRINLAYSNMNEPEVKANGSEYVVNFKRNLDNQVYFTKQSDYIFSFEDEKSIALLEIMIVQTKAVLVIIDPLYSTNGDTEKFFSGMGNQITKLLKPIRQRTGCTFILVHHTTKSGDTLDVNKVWGSQIMLAAFESKIILAMENAEKPTEISIGRNYKDTGNLDVIKLKFNIDKHSFAYSVDISEASKEDKRSFMLITYLSEHGPTKYGELRKEFDEKFEMSSGSQLSSFMKKRPEIFVSHGSGTWGLTPDYLKGKKND